MQPIMSKPSKAALLAIVLVTLGALIMLNTAIVYLYITNHQPPPGSDEPRNDSYLYWCASLFFSGMILFVIGFTLGRIGRSARKAELPPEVSGAPTAQPAVTAPPVAQTMLPNGQVVAPGQVAIPGQAMMAQAPPVANTAPVAPVR